jgi:hypothetical protein
MAPAPPVEFLRIFGALKPGPMQVVFEATHGWGWFAVCWPLPA